MKTNEIQLTQSCRTQLTQSETSTKLSCLIVNSKWKLGQKLTTE